MPVPRPEQVTGLISDLVARAGLDLEDVTVTAAGRRSVVKVVVGSDAPLDLDSVAELSRAVSGVLDDHEAFGEAPYTLEVTTPGVDRPLIAPRHWRRARGRRVNTTVDGEPLTARVGPLVGDSVTLVVGGKGGPSASEVEFERIGQTSVEVEFSPADPREVELAGTPAGPARGDDEPSDAELGDDEPSDDESAEHAADEGDGAPGHSDGDHGTGARR